MAATFFYDAMHPVPNNELPPGQHSGERQLEVYTHGNFLYVRLGPVGDENAGQNCYSVRLTPEQAQSFRDDVDAAAFYLSGLIGQTPQT